MVVHGGTAHFLHPAMLQSTKRQSREAALQSLDECASQAERLGVTLCLENLCYLDSIPGTLAETADVVRSVGRKSLQATLDVAHFHVSGETVESIRDAAPLIRHVHISDNNGLDDAHLPMGQGMLQVERFLPLLRAFEGPIVLEIEDVEDPVRSARESRAWLERYLS
ncbi:MAG: sugar phosphate isomerase/epimerase family protein [Bacillota bacterium]